MNPTLKKGIFITLGVAAVIVVGLLVYNKLKKPVSDTPQGFNELIERVQKIHPEIYAWWEKISINQQIQIENSMTPEILVILSKELVKKNLSEEAKLLLSKAGYRA